MNLSNKIAKALGDRSRVSACNSFYEARILFAEDEEGTIYLERRLRNEICIQSRVSNLATFVPKAYVDPEFNQAPCFLRRLNTIDVTSVNQSSFLWLSSTVENCNTYQLFEIRDNDGALSTYISRLKEFQNGIFQVEISTLRIEK